MSKYLAVFGGTDIGDYRSNSLVLNHLTYLGVSGSSEKKSPILR